MEKTEDTRKKLVSKQKQTNKKCIATTVLIFTSGHKVIVRLPSSTMHSMFPL